MMVLDKSFVLLFESEDLMGGQDLGILVRRDVRDDNCMQGSFDWRIIHASSLLSFFKPKI
jgi:hypothetical protein